MSRGLLWYRSDLRLKDNPALTYACANCNQLAFVYFYNPADTSDWKLGSTSKWWIHHSLNELRNSLCDNNADLDIILADPSSSLLELCQNNHIDHVFWNRLYEPNNTSRDKKLKKSLLENNVKVKSFNASLLYEPWEISKPDGTPYRVFTPFWNTIRKRGLDFKKTKNIRSFPEHIKLKKISSFEKNILNANLLPKLNWNEQFHQYWQPGENGAAKKLKAFFKYGLENYSSGRDFPEKDYTSRLSPHLHFGELSSRQIILAIRKLTDKNSSEQMLEQGNTFTRQLVWREFAHHLLYHFPKTVDQPLNHKYIHFPWAKEFQINLHSWQNGQTGIPIIDAGMRELWHSGWMHNRVRMIVGSLLTKNLRIPWQEGSKWFWDTLVDADLANNTLGWQWIAGCGADAAPYYRIFNPVLQSQKFDPSGSYIRKWVPELSKLPDKLIHAPWESSTADLKKFGVSLNKHYPKPIVDLKKSREQALNAYNKIK
ncbi:MAG: deoxyribodipyrimidine photo-lyase [Pseudomonadota bacterium]